MIHSQTSSSGPDAAMPYAPPERSPAARFRRVAINWFRHQPLGAFGSLALALIVFTALFADVVAPKDPLALDITNKLDSPSGVHPFGTDEYGRDILSRTIFGLRVAVQVALYSVGISTVLGLFLGVTSAYRGGWTDLVVQRIVDMFMAFPAVILALAIVSVFGRSVTNIAIALAIVQTPNVTRVVRATALTIRERVFVEAARAVGAPDTRIVLRHVLPNTIPVVIVVASSSIGNAVLAEASLSFLGLGIAAPEPSLGGMLSGSARRFGEQAPWLIIFPGLVLSAFVFSANFLGDALRDVLDPRLRGRR